MVSVPSPQVKLHDRATGTALLWVFILTLISLAMPRAAHAQVLYGSLTGNVTDQNSAVVAGAKVEAVNIGTGASQSAIADERGVYLFSNLQPGIYKVTITATSFKPVAQENVRIDVNTVRRFDASCKSAR